MDTNNADDSPFLLFNLPDETVELAFVPFFLGSSSTSEWGRRSRR